MEIKVRFIAGKTAQNVQYAGSHGERDMAFSLPASNSTWEAEVMDDYGNVVAMARGKTEAEAKAKALAQAEEVAE